MEDLTRLPLSSNDDKRMQSIDSIETHSCGMRKYLVSEKQEIKCNNIRKRYNIAKMFNFDDVATKNIKDYNPNWPQIPVHPYKISIIGGSGSGKTNSLFNSISQLPDIDKICLYAKDAYETKYQFLISK